MSLWIPAPVEKEPEIYLSQWSIKQLPNGDRHFVGYNANWQEGRVSSRIVEFDKDKMRGVTRSGRVYELVGESGTSMDAEYVWGQWLYINHVSKVDDAKVIVLREEDL